VRSDEATSFGCLHRRTDGRINKWTGQLEPAAPFEVIAAETFRRLHVEVLLGALARDYNAGLTTQLPVSGVVSTRMRRIRREIPVGRKQGRTSEDYSYAESRDIRRGWCSPR